MVAALAVAALLEGCATSRGRPDDGLIPGSPPSAPGDGVEQELFRVSYRGVDGRGRLRLVLRRSGEAFRLDAADPFGRALWTFGATGGTGILVDHRETVYCRVDETFAIDAVALSELPVRVVPRLLSGALPAELPEPLRPAVDGEVDLRDLAGRRWTARFRDGVLESWTLYSDDEPLLWWLRQPEGGILSHRDGAQATWARTAFERVGGRLEAVEPPSGYTAVSCDEADEDDLA